MKSQSANRKLLWTLLTVVPASLAVAGALVYRRYRRDLTAAKARVSSGSKLANTPSGLIEYADVGTGTPVFVIHGAGGGFDQGLEFARPLIDAGFRVIAPSRFGYLRTPLPKDASPMAQADAHAGLLDALQLEKVAVVASGRGSLCHAVLPAAPQAVHGAGAGSSPGVWRRPCRPPPSALREFSDRTWLSAPTLFFGPCQSWRVIRCSRPFSAHRRKT